MSALPTVGLWAPSTEKPVFNPDELKRAVERFREPAFVVLNPETGAVGVAHGGGSSDSGYPLLASLAPIYPEWLGDRSFCETHGVRFPYVSGAMANGIATAELVISMSQSGFLGFFGAAGLDPDRISKALDKIEASLGRENSAWGSNLIHSPNEPAIEAAVADLYIRRGVRKVSAAAYMKLTPAVVRYAMSGVYLDSDGRIQRKNYLFAKISRPEVAQKFMEPPPEEMLQGLVSRGELSAEEARLARKLPVAEDYIIESDSGGHTDNQSLSALFPTIQNLRNRIVREQQYTRPIRLGAAGGLGTPQAVAAAFSMGAAFVLTGSVNQACIESGLHSEGREMLAKASLADVVMAPAADMFELGVEVQVLKRGTMFGVRAKKLYEFYRGHNSIEDLSSTDQVFLEKNILGESIQDSWSKTRAYWANRDPQEVAKAERDSKHKMALIFRSYLGQSSRWAIAGDPKRRMDYQIWCGPAMGSFNDWVRGSFLEEPSNRQAAQVALNMMEGAAVLTRAQQLRSFGAPLPPAAFDFRPRPLS